MSISDVFIRSFAHSLIRSNTVAAEPIMRKTKWS